MGPKKGRRNVRMIEVPADKHTEFELGDTAADIQSSREEREQREREEQAQKQQTESEMDIEGGGISDVYLTFLQ